MVAIVGGSKVSTKLTVLDSLFQRFTQRVQFSGQQRACARHVSKFADTVGGSLRGTAHRAQASTHGIGKFADVACAGPLLAAELDALGNHRTSRLFQRFTQRVQFSGQQRACARHVSKFADTVC
jgi:3-phosphoglycerate kinase